LEIQIKLNIFTKIIMAKGKSLNEAASSAIKTGASKAFDLDSFKKSKYLTTAVKFKEQKWIPLSDAFQNVTSIPGIPMGHITLLRGHSDTGKSTAMLEAAVNAQKMGILPVFLITEMKWNWEHAREMGLEFNEIADPDTGEVVDFNGFFLFADRSNLNSVEDVSAFISDLLDEQKSGNLPHDLLFLWDSIGSITCQMSLNSGKNNNEWIAGAMSTQFANGVNQKILLSRKESYPYTNTLVCVNKVWTQKAETPMSQPKMMNKGGMAMWYDATCIITFGNVSNAGTNKIKATKNGKDVEFAKRTKIQVEKNHVNGVSSKGSIIMTVHGFIEDDKKAIDDYKKLHSKEWLEKLGESDFDIVIERDDLIDDIGFKQEPE
jgi:hypothetical protein